jgi:threonine/homoserine/homoserine lactone efflux protein
MTLTLTRTVWFVVLKVVGVLTLNWLFITVALTLDVLASEVRHEREEKIRRNAWKKGLSY